jgi:succinate dehydrogenase/fumarate reductase cytochrome b subunit
MEITEILYLALVVYIVVLIMWLIVLYAEDDYVNPSDWVKVIFWPITVSIFLLGVMLSLSIKFFKGILLCFGEIKEYFVTTFYSAIKDENK